MMGGSLTARGALWNPSGHLLRMEAKMVRFSFNEGPRR